MRFVSAENPEARQFLIALEQWRLVGKSTLPTINLPNPIKIIEQVNSFCRFYAGIIERKDEYRLESLGLYLGLYANPGVDVDAALKDLPINPTSEQIDHLAMDFGARRRDLKAADGINHCDKTPP